ncbi:MAG TPA: hypothetical protein VFD58_27160 [Blastocatellia bacterium]|nr:hypothetical protein [Blastocatellia bacterium]
MPKEAFKQNSTFNHTVRIAFIATVLLMGMMCAIPFITPSRAAATDTIIRTPAGSGVYGFAGDNGPATSAFFATPSATAVDADGNFYIADAYNNRIRKVSTQGVVTTFAGTGVGGYTGDNGPAAQAQIDTPTSLAFDRGGNLYFTDSLNSVVRKIDPGGKITTFAGNGQDGYGGDNGPATQAALSFPQSLALDATGRVYICDTFNNRIRRVDLQGTITTVAGNGTAGDAGDGGAATQAQLDAPQGVAVDRVGNLFIADTSNFIVRKVDAGGKISTIAGNRTDGYGGDNGPATQAKMGPIRGLAVDPDGNVLISDPGNDRIRRVDTGGTITTIAGNGVTGYNSDGILATQAFLNEPVGVTLDPFGVIYVADSYNDRVRMLKSTQLSLFGLSRYVIQTGEAGVTLRIIGAGLEGTSVTINGQSLASTLDPATGNLSVTPPSPLLAASGTLLVQVNGAGGASGTKSAVVASSGQLNPGLTTSVLAASYQPSLAPDSITAMFGSKLATQLAVATAVPLPTTLAGTRVYANGTAAPLFFVSPTQVNYLLPPEAAAGANTSVVTISGDGTVSQEQLRTAYEAPGLFTANASGSGGPAGLWTLDGVNYFSATNPDGTLTPIPAGAYLVLFGTGIRHAPDPDPADGNGVAEVTQASFGVTPAQAAFAGPQGGFVGLDQINVQIPAGLSGKGQVNLAILVDGKAANTVQVLIQ